MATLQVMRDLAKSDQADALSLDRLLDIAGWWGDREGMAVGYARRQALTAKVRAYLGLPFPFR